MHRQKQKNYIMNVLKKYKLVTTANNVAVVTAYDRLMYAQDYEDVFWDFCCLHLLDGESVLYRLDDSKTYKMCWKHVKKFKPLNSLKTLDLS